MFIDMLFVIVTHRNSAILVQWLLRIGVFVEVLVLSILRPGN
jgi:hypothetical protein